MAQDLQDTGITELDLPSNDLWTMELHILTQFFALLAQIQTLKVLRLQFNGDFKETPSQESLTALFSTFSEHITFVFDERQRALCDTLSQDGKHGVIGDDSGNYEDPTPSAKI